MFEDFASGSDFVKMFKQWFWDTVRIINDLFFYTFQKCKDFVTSAFQSFMKKGSYLLQSVNDSTYYQHFKDQVSSFSSSVSCGLSSFAQSFKVVSFYTFQKSTHIEFWCGILLKSSKKES